MSAIGKGDWLLCIEATGWKGVEVVEGNVYCVERVEEALFPCLCGDRTSYGVQLVGLTLADGAAWCLCCFRPLGGGQALTAPPARVCEPA